MPPVIASKTVSHLLHLAIADAADRSALTPTTTKALIDAGYKINVERSPQRIFDDKEYEEVGATLVPENTWRDAPDDNIIIGLKELPVETCELIDV